MIVIVERQVAAQIFQSVMVMRVGVPLSLHVSFLISVFALRTASELSGQMLQVLFCPAAVIIDATLFALSRRVQWR